MEQSEFMGTGEKAKSLVPKTWTTLRKGIETDLPGTQITESEGHERSRKDGKFHDGGPFNTYRQRFEVGSSDVAMKKWTGTGWYRYNGPCFTPWPQVPVGFMPSFEEYGAIDFDSLDEDGATAIARVAPTNPVSKFSLLLGEVKKDGIPSIPGILSWKDRTNLARSAGSEYLNYQFGWRPLVEEVLQVGDAARGSAYIAKQFQRDEGKNVQREFRFDDEYTQSQSTSSTSGAILNTSGLENEFRDGVGAKLTKTTEVLSRKWFSGAFTYALPSRTDSFRRMLGYGTEAERMFGIPITPDVLWELSPWSWAIDWFSNVGDVIHNATNFGLAGLVMRYGYMMRETSHTITHSLDRSGFTGNIPAPPASVVYTTTKTRRAANPFGFGYTEPDLSPTQIAIAVALGLSHLL